MRSLQGLIGEMEEEGVEVIFVQPQFSKDEASAAADAVGAELVELNPLPEDYQEGMRRLARRIRDGLQGQGGS
jgi:zinc transport system substrate-binding protein